MIRKLIVLAVAATALALPARAGAATWYWSAYRADAMIWASDAVDYYGDSPSGVLDQPADLLSVRCRGVGRRWLRNGYPLYRRLGCVVVVYDDSNPVGGYESTYQTTIAPLDRVEYRDSGWEFLG